MAALPSRRLSRAKTDVDIVEHVLEGVQTEVVSGNVLVTDVGLRPWLGGLIASAVQVQVVRTGNGDADE
jgi:hypothetical protein